MPLIQDCSQLPLDWTTGDYNSTGTQSQRLLVSISCQCTARESSGTQLSSAQQQKYASPCLPEMQTPWRPLLHVLAEYRGVHISEASRGVPLYAHPWIHTLPALLLKYLWMLLCPSMGHIWLDTLPAHFFHVRVSVDTRVSILILFYICA